MLDKHFTKQASRKEFVAIMALLMSLLALSIDAILPALSEIGNSLGVDSSQPNRNQLLLTTIFIGMSAGLMLYGPLSDSYGRKKTIFLGVGIFIIGSLISILSTDFETMLVGRFVQGFGAAACRVVSIAMIRDKYEGAEMAKIMSLITAIFIIVPAIAPSIGQGILLFAPWKAIFIFMLLVAIVSVVWLYFRQPETLKKESKINFSFQKIARSITETIKNPISFGYTLAAGLIFGSFVGYLSTAQQILQVQYALGDKFSIVFGGLAIAIGLSSYANSKLLKTFSMVHLCLFSLIVLSLFSVGFYGYCEILSEQPSLVEMLVFLLIAFLNLGILFGNLNSLALEPLGHIAGTATSVVSSIQTFLSVIVGGVVGFFYDSSVTPLILGFMLTSLASLFIVVGLNVNIARNRTKLDLS